MPNNKPSGADTAAHQANQRFTHPDRVTDAALDWFLRLSNGSLDARSHEEFVVWLARDESHRTAYRRVSEVWSLPELHSATAALAARDNPPVPMRPHSARPVARAFAIAAILAVLTLGAAWWPDLMLRWRSDYQTAAGARQTVTLPDGSEMVLNTGSAVALGFKSGARSVTLLQGEAFFEVRPDPDRPFTVVAPHAQVTVLGTGFSVQAAGDKDHVTLKHGRVEVQSGDGDNAGERIVLEPGQTVTAGGLGLGRAVPVDTEVSLAWLEGRVIFDDEPLPGIIEELRRYYPHRILIPTGRFDNLRVSGNYRLSDPETVIRSLAIAAGAHVTRIPGGTIILR